MSDSSGRVHECDVLEHDIVPGHHAGIGCKRVEFLTERIDFAGIIIVGNDRAIHTLTNDGNMRFPGRDEEFLVVHSVLHEDDILSLRIISAGGDRFLDSSEIAAAIPGNDKIVLCLGVKQ